MGINNRQRRAATVRRRTRSHPHRPSRLAEHREAPSDRDPSALDVRSRLLSVAATGDAVHRRAQSERLADVDATMLDEVAELELLARLDLLWRHGWQPAEVVREVRRHDARAGRLVTVAVAADHVERPTATSDDRWRAQVEALDAPPVRRRGWLREIADLDRLHRAVLVSAVVEALHGLLDLGPVPPIVPPPGESARPPSTAAGVDSAMLAKVRALLAQAESTSFEAEADAFTAKAQELMARHAIDETVLWAASDQRDRPASTRVPIDDPYADIKSLLLQHVAAHGRCRAVWIDRYGWSTLVGFPTDVAAVELLFTSLLVQANNALRAEAETSPPGGRSRTRAFRSSFLLAFTVRIDRRLGEIAAAAEAASDHDASTLLPALVARHEAVDDELDALFGPVMSNPVRGGRDAAGWAHGTLAADLARLHSGDLTYEATGPPA